jgi:ankyrin repeat protein
LFFLKGFKTLTQVQLLSDVLYYTPHRDSEPWLIYYISKPLVGTYEASGIIQAIAPGHQPIAVEPPSGKSKRENPSSDTSQKEIRSFSDLLTRFPMISRQMQPGLERVFSEFGKELGKPLPPPPSPFPGSDEPSPDHTSATEQPSSSTSHSSSVAYERLPFSSTYFEDDEDIMRRALETAVTSAIDLFRLVDKQQLSLLGATTDLTGPMVERLIERYVAEQVHDTLLFPRLCSCREAEDAELDRNVRRMEGIDVSQVGITIDGGRRGKEELTLRLGRGVEEFRKMADAKCPQAMLEALLSTLKTITMAPHRDKGDGVEEKKSSVLTVNADILVSLLLVVVIRAQLRHLQARLLYMQQFVFIDDVESGEYGYALSTLEGVLTYLRNDSAGLRKASSRNKRLWLATKSGRVQDMKAILEPHLSPSREGSVVLEPDEEDSSFEEDDDDAGVVPPSSGSSHMNGKIVHPHQPDPGEPPDRPETPRLSHVFPFQTWPLHGSESPHNHALPPRKRVTMDMRSLSEVSTVSFLSRSTTGASIVSAIEGDTSIESMTQTQGPAGDSVPMMAIEGRQPESLKYLLSLEEYYPIEAILEDTNSDGTTLLSAAVQLGHGEIVDILLEFIQSHTRNSQGMMAYLSKADMRGRTVAHYLFSVPWLITRLGSQLPWRQKDRNGQTPLFALCRSYDHPDYTSMVSEALTAAQEAQGDGQALRLDDHVDAKGNTLLHAVSDPQIVSRILKECDCDPNATNDKKFTPLMMASKYGRVDLVRIFFADPRVDIHMRESRGLTAIELAKDDGVRSRIDDLTLLSNPPPKQEPESSWKTVQSASSSSLVRQTRPIPQIRTRTSIRCTR